MNKCTELDIKEMLPDLLHGGLDAHERARVESHIASCVECTEELEVLRAVKSAAVFIPAIDVHRVVRQIPPYRTIVPTRRLPARSRAVAWLVVASLALVVAGGGSVLLQQQRTERRIVSIDDHRSVPAPEQGRPRASPPLPPRLPCHPTPGRRGTSPPRRAHAHRAPWRDIRDTP